MRKNVSFGHSSSLERKWLAKLCHEEDGAMPNGGLDGGHGLFAEVLDGVGKFAPLRTVCLYLVVVHFLSHFSFKIVFKFKHTILQ